VEGVDVLHRLLSEETVNVRTELVVIRGTQRLEMKVLPQMRQR